MIGFLKKSYSFLFPFRKAVSEISAALKEISTEQEQTQRHLLQILGHIKEEQEKLSMQEKELALAVTAGVDAIGRHLNVISDTQNSCRREILEYVKGLGSTSDKIFNLTSASGAVLKEQFGDGAPGRMDARFGELALAVTAGVDAIGRHLNVISDTQNACRREILEYAKGLGSTSDKIFNLTSASGAVLKEQFGDGAPGRMDARFADILRRADELETTTGSLARQTEDLQKQTIRSVIQTRWRLSDDLSAQKRERREEIVRCPLCGHSGKKSAYETKQSFCVFGGGRLERYVCPDCDLIFGPLKMLELSPQELREEYEQNYSVFRESDTGPYEIALFYAMRPRKEHVYLNYGAGGWNDTGRQLRESGFQVYDYEPFAPVRREEWIITDRERLGRMRFDGIFSNDLIEHLRFPVEELRFMKSILRPGGKMYHATGCYEYAFEYTRFHLFYFTGRSLPLLAQKCGLKVELTGRIHPGQSSLRYAIFTTGNPEQGDGRK